MLVPPLVEIACFAFYFCPEVVLAGAEKAAYSKDLITFSSVDYFETKKIPYIPVLSVTLEPAEDPLDEKAIIISEKPE